MNKIILIGRVGKEPEMRSINAGIDICSLTLATSESYKDKQTGERKIITEWHNCVAFGQLASVISKFVKKGDMLTVEGKIKTDSYIKNDEKRYSTKIIINNIEFCGLKKDSNSQSDKQSNINTNEQVGDLPF